jgi:hypothetical protein
MGDRGQAAVAGLVAPYRSGLAALDGPARLLAVAAAALPEDRRDWGAAMAAELAQAPERGARWRFALSSARAAIFPPRGG